MILKFHKYQGTGNDFLMVDDRDETFDPERLDVVQRITRRRFGVGSDGLILLRSREGYDFEMVFFNPDGSKSLCGNGSRCVVAFAKALGIIGDSARFLAIDGEHTATIDRDGIVSLKMNDVKNVEKGEDFFYLNTGSPHYCTFVNEIQDFDVMKQGKRIRYSERFKKEGTNVNFLEKVEDGVFVRTYERGVESETYSCGTGVTASGLVAALKGVANGKDFCDIQTLGGKLKVKFNRVSDGVFTDIYLEGPALFVFRGEIEI
jgi:diaminopimelate epimerase